MGEYYATPPSLTDGKILDAEPLDSSGNKLVSLSTKIAGEDIPNDVMKTSEAAPTAIFNGKKTVTTAGTRVVLATTQAVKSVTIKALKANTSTIYVGNATVASTNGLALEPGESVSLDIANLTTVNLDSAVNGEGVTYIGVN